MPSVPASLRDAFDAYLAGPRRLRAALAGLDPVLLNQRPYGSEWSIRDVVLHVADAEIVRAERFRRLIAEDEPTLPPFDQERWKRRLFHLWRDVELALSLLELLCHANAELLGQLDRAGWERQGHHPELGPLSVGELLRHGADHFEDHAAQVIAMRRALGRAP